MTLRDHTEAAGAKAPAAAASRTWVDWDERADPPVYQVTLWPHRSLSPEGRRTVLMIVAGGLCVPLMPAFGTPVFWGLLPFCVAALTLLWLGFRRSAFDGTLTEEFRLWRDEVRVERREPQGRVLRWRAQPYRLRLRLHPEGAKVENYLTLKGEGREIELGSFLSPEERLKLKAEIEAALAMAV